jgi:hypothetical protein
MSKFRPLVRSGRRHMIMRNALFRFMSNRNEWFTSGSLIAAFESGAILNKDGHRYKYGPMQPVGLSNIMKKDARFECRDIRVKNITGSSYILKEWRAIP